MVARMGNIELLDCTLRDGGYINDWKFGYHTIRDIVNKLVESQVDYVEIGFLRNCQYDRNTAVFNNCAEIRNILPGKKGNTKFTAMALHNKYDIDKLEDYDGSTIDALRITFHDYDIEEGLAYIQKAISKGYKVFVNPINIMGYSDGEILRLIEKINRIKPYAFSIVDTFGSMMKDDLLRIYSLMEHNLDKSVVIGLHLHENLGLSYSLAQEFISMKSIGRKCVIDGSMFGMGRAPGNLCMELVMDYMNRTQNGTYNVNPVLDGIDDHIARLKSVEPWGYNTAYALSAKFNLHRNYAEFLLGKGRLRAKQINQILAGIEENKKTAYDEAYIESLYQKFQNHKINDEQLIERLKGALTGAKVLILAPGYSIVSEKENIREFIEKEKPVVFAANFAPEEYRKDYIFCSNAVRYEALKETLKERQDKTELLITSNLLDFCDTSENVLNFAELSFDELGNCENCVIMLVKLLIRLEVKEVVMAGFDGYKEESRNYVDSYLPSQHTKGQEENIKLRKYLAELKKKIPITFLADSIYEK